MRRVWITRHGERLDKVDRNWLEKCEMTNQDDPPLADKGRVQAAELAQRLRKDTSIAYIFSSPFRRCVETGNIIAEKLDLPVKVEPGICEVLWTHPPGYLRVDELKAKFSRVDPDYEWAAEDYRMSQHKSEMTDHDVFPRVATAVKKILTRYPEGEILFVGHGASVAGILQGLSPKLSYVGLCSLSLAEGTLDNFGSWHTPLRGDFSHLSDKTDLRAY